MTAGQAAERARHPEAAAAGLPPGARLVDVDVHAPWPGATALFPYLNEYWCDQIRQASTSSDLLSEIRVDWFGTPARVAYPIGVPTSALPGTSPAAGDEATTALDRLRGHVFDAWGAQHAIVHCAYFVNQYHNAYLAQAFASALNDWLVAEHLEADARLRGSMLVVSSQPQMAVEEIERVGAHPQIVQVLLPARSAVPYGNPQYHPVFEAAARHDLVVGVHFGGWPGYPSTGVGWTSYYIEEYAGRAQVFQSQLVSIVSEGVFDRVPEARLALVEGGFAWLPSLLWRFDKDWKSLRREVPWLKRPPSDYVRDHVKLSVQPYDGPDDPGFMARIVDQLGSDDMLMFATDFPHWHYDTAEQALPPGAVEDEGLLGKLLFSNANDFYRLEDRDGD